MNRRYIQLSDRFLKALTASNRSFLLEKNLENYLSKRWAGHSKWQNIKSTKEANDRSRAQMFDKISRIMFNAVKDGGDNPITNNKLKLILEEAKKSNMPKATIEKIIKTAKSQSSEKPYWTVFSGPKDLVLALEVIFANRKPSYLMSKLGSQTKKLKLKLEPHFNHLCSERGLIITEPPSNTDDSYEKAVEDAIEIGVDEVLENSDKSLTFECISDRIDSLSKKLKEKGYKIVSESIEIDFNNTINISEEELKNVEDLIIKLQKIDEVIRATHNAEAQ